MILVVAYQWMRSRPWLFRLSWIMSGVFCALFAALRPLPELPWTEADRASSFKDLRHSLRSARAKNGAATLRAGVARIELARPGDKGVPLGGNPGFILRRRADGPAEESVWVRAVALDQGERRAVLVSVDVLAIHPALVQRVLELLPDDLRLEADELMLVATHTHNGPGGYWKGLLPAISMGRYEEDRFEFLSERCAETIRRAFESMAPATLSHGAIKVQAPLVNQRDLHAARNTEFSLVRLEARDHSFVADIVNYSAHPTARLREASDLSGDYPGVLAHRLEDERRTVLFTPGTIGDLRPKDLNGRGNKTTDLAHHLDTEGWQKVQMTEVEQPRLLSFEFDVHLPDVQVRALQSSWFGGWCLREWLAELILPSPLAVTTVQILQIGPVVFLGAPCDLNTSVGLPLIRKGKKLGLAPIFVSMAEDWVGYVMTEEEYYGGFKATNQFHGPGMGSLFSTLYRETLKHLQRSNP